jgi:hypothetical protein
MGVDEDTFYDPRLIATLPMGFCFPGRSLLRERIKRLVQRSERRVKGMLALFFVALSPAAAAQEDSAGGPATIFAKLEGQWIGSGVLLGRPAEFLMRWEIGTEGFVRLIFSNAWVSEDGSRTPVLSSEATYLPNGSSALGVWLDDRPQQLALHATLTDSTVVTSWTAGAEEGRTEYLARSGEVVVFDIVYVDGSERRFAEATYRRIPPPSG